jgi:hypothetical protein
MVSMIKPMQKVYAFAVIKLLSHGISESSKRGAYFLFIGSRSFNL